MGFLLINNSIIRGKMSMYNMMNGVTPYVFLILPMLGERHPDEYPRFRDLFLKDEEHPKYDGYIHIYTRVGGPNRGEGCGEETLYKHPNYVDTFDDSFDSTYGTYVFSIPDEWKDDFIRVTTGKFDEVSLEYRERLNTVFPKLKSKFIEIFSSKIELS